MKRLVVGECLWPHTARVLEHQRPSHVPAETVFAVFADSTEGGAFCGLATAHDIAQHPDWIFADLSEHRPRRSVTPDADVRKALSTMDGEGLHALPVLDPAGAFVGAVTRESILLALLQRERDLLRESRKLKRLADYERKQVLIWSRRLSELHEASRALLNVLAHTSLETDLLQAGIEALAKLLQARYGAIGILDDGVTLRDFVYTGIGQDQVQRIDHFPEGRGLLGVVIQENLSLRLDDISKDHRSAGFPPNHPPMKSLLAVPISHRSRVYGRIYLCDKESGEPFSRDDELLAQSFAHSLSLVLDNARELEEVKQARQKLDYMAHFDALTGLPNRTLLADRMLQMLVRAKRNNDMMAVMFIDLDDFKNVNDTLGHSLGDVLLKEAAQRVSSCLRAGDTVARLGGDEFVILLPDLADAQDVAAVAEKIQQSLSQLFIIEQHEIYAGASIGISIFPADASEMDGLLAAADTAMYHAKKLGKNNYQFFAKKMNIFAQARLKIEKHLRHALERQELLLFYQPQVDSETGRMIGMEALLRWNHPEFGLMAPADFIPAAEDTGWIIPIGAWVLRTACTQARLWQESGAPVRVAVNLSGRQFQQQNSRQLLDAVRMALDESGLSSDLLELEITESIMMQHVDTTLETIDQLKDMGLRLSLDDFGTGYSSLSYLKRFPIDAIKIDRSFVDDIATDPNDAAIVAAVTAMAHQLNLAVVAEGVETAEQVDFLHSVGCHIIQGYYFSRPVAAEEATLLLRRGLLPIKEPAR